MYDQLYYIRTDMCLHFVVYISYAKVRPFRKHKWDIKDLKDNHYIRNIRY